MDKLKYKTFVWPHNPTVYKDEYVRSPRYRIVDGEIYYLGMGDVQRVISGSGVFFGENAFADFKKLAFLFDDTTPGDLVHPIWGKCHCYFTGLKLTQEPKDDYVSYQFEFTWALPDGEIPQ